MRRGEVPGAEVVLLGLGSNLGDRMGHLRDAVSFLATETTVEEVSGVYETPAEVVSGGSETPVGAGGDQPPFLNLAVRARSPLTPREFLELARTAESRAGRERPYRGAPRTVDVDVLFHGSRIVDEPELEIPHPRWAERSFVVRPLLDLAPDLRDPRSGRTVREVWEEDGPGPRPIREVLPPGRLILDALIPFSPSPSDLP